MDAVTSLKQALEAGKTCACALNGGCPVYGKLKSLAERGGGAIVSKGGLHKAIMSGEGDFAERQSECWAMLLTHEAYLYKSME